MTPTKLDRPDPTAGAHRLPRVAFPRIAMEQALVTSITHDQSVAKLTVSDIPDRPGVAAELFQAIAAEGVSVDMILQNVSHDGLAAISVTVPRGEAARARQAVERAAAGHVEADDAVHVVGVDGAGFSGDGSVAAKMFATLAGHGINIEMITASAVRISCVVTGADVDEAIAALRQEFGV